MRTLLALLAAVSLCSCTRVVQSAPDPEYLTPYGAPKNPFSPAVRVGNRIFLAGQIGTDTLGQARCRRHSSGSAAGAQQHQRRAEKSGSSLDRIVKCTVFMADMKEWPAMNEIYVTYFRTH